MKALQFGGCTANHDQIRVPPDGADQIPEGSPVRGILLLDMGEDESWRELSRGRFFAAYSEEDAVYEQLDHGPAIR